MDTALPLKDALPELLNFAAEGGDGAHACDNDSSFHRFVGSTDSEPGVQSKAATESRLRPSSLQRYRC
ncbi:hypothetical protein PLANPX_5070 [Lacipirellula parvula]|uniref:Uncharacterized protein n=1 Tax=Lacipirellula parvula TaxID=2650471 RepID=A0A5K7XG12_9BACT|nr:hypothetical protein PLANPX_5070 [Lacipirellula parvula]